MVDKNIVLIGGHSGIGDASRKLLLQNGANIYTASRRKIQAGARIHQHLQIDVLDENLNLETLPEEIHGMVYFPGSIVLKPFRNLNIDQFRADFEINVLGAVKVLQKLYNRLVSGSSIVLFSTVAFHRGLPFHSSVGASKGAVEGLIKSLAAEWAPRIRINGIAPSLTDTDMAQKLLNTDQKRNASSERHPLKRIGTPIDIANAVGFLISDKSSWITGQVLRVDGGLSVI